MTPEIQAEIAQQISLALQPIVVRLDLLSSILGFETNAECDGDCGRSCGLDSCPTTANAVDTLDNVLMQVLQTQTYHQAWIDEIESITDLPEGTAERVYLRVELMHLSDLLTEAQAALEKTEEIPKLAEKVSTQISHLENKISQIHRVLKHPGATQ